MKDGFAELEDFERGLGRLHKGLQGGEEWLKARAPHYRSLVDKISVQVLMGMKPQEVDAEEWDRQVQEFSTFLGWKATTSGFEIFYRKYVDAQINNNSKVDIRYQDVLAWVQAGVEKGGKDKSASEVAAGKTDEEIAYVVNNAINQYRFGFSKNSDYARITDRLEDWVKGKFLSADLGEVLEKVLAAWMAALAPVMEKDFDEWLDEQIRKSF
jgi:hypothetical protein